MIKENGIRRGIGFVGTLVTAVLAGAEERRLADPIQGDDDPSKARTLLGAIRQNVLEYHAAELGRTFHEVGKLAAFIEQGLPLTVEYDPEQFRGDTRHLVNVLGRDNTDPFSCMTVRGKYTFEVRKVKKMVRAGVFAKSVVEKDGQPTGFYYPGLGEMIVLGTHAKQYQRLLPPGPAQVRLYTLRRLAEGKPDTMDALFMTRKNTWITVGVGPGTDDGMLSPNNHYLVVKRVDAK